MRTLFSIFIWIYWTACILFFFLVVLLLYLLTLPIDRFNTIPNKALKGLAWVMMRPVPGWSFTIRGTHTGKIGKPTLVIANHQSFLDMPLSYLLPWNMKWVAKRSLFRIPLFGWMIFMTGHVGIDRHSLRSVKRLDKLVKPIREGIPGMIFPEGTRTEDGKLKPFKKGAFVLAKEYNLQVLPLVLEGGYQAMPAGTWRLMPGQHFDIAVLDPLDPDDFDSAEELKQHAYRLIEKELHAIRS